MSQTSGVLSLSAEDAVHDDREDRTFLTGFESLHVSFPAEDAAGDYCIHCAEGIEEDPPQGWLHSHSSAKRCDGSPFVHIGDEDDGEIAEPDPSPGSWCNSASVYVDDDENSVTVTISVGDPRGAFAMTVTRGDDGELRLHLPYEGQGMPHMPLKQLHEGTYVIGGAA